MDLVTLALLKKLIEANNTIDYYDSKADLPAEGAINHLYKAGNALYEWDPVAKDYIPLTADSDVLATLERQVAALKGAIIPDASNQTNDGYDLAYGVNSITVPFNKDLQTKDYSADQKIAIEISTTTITFTPINYPTLPYYFGFRYYSISNNKYIYINTVINESGPIVYNMNNSADIQIDKDGNYIIEVNYLIPQEDKTDLAPFSLGVSNVAAGAGALSVGFRNNSIGNGTFTTGYHNKNISDCGFVFGANNISYSNAGLVGGNSNIVRAGQVIVFGQFNDIKGRNSDSIIFGYKNIIEKFTNDNIISMSNLCSGIQNTVKNGAYGSCVIGQQNTLGAGFGNAIFGSNNEIINSINNCLIAGYHCIGVNSTQRVFGQYNETNQDAQYIDIVAYGYGDNNRRNLYTLDRNGNAWFRGAIAMIDEGNKFESLGDNAVLTKTYANKYYISKITNEATQRRAYIITKAGEQSTLAIDSGAAENALAVRDAHGRLLAASPSVSNDGNIFAVANVAYLRQYYLQKILTPNTNKRHAYIIEKGNITSTLQIDIGPIEGTLAARTTDGALQVGNPTDGNHAVNLRYFNTTIGNIETVLDEIIELQNGLMGEAILESIIDEQTAVIAAQEELIGGDSE